MQPFLVRSQVTELLYVLRGELFSTSVWYLREEREADRQRSLLMLAERVRAIETVHNATRVILALEAWKLEHGALPKRLEDLVGSCLDKLPHDPYSGENFQYLPAGQNMPLRWHQPVVGWSVGACGGTIPAHTPFIWSTGMNVRKESNPTTKDHVDRYEIRQDQRSNWHRPKSEFDVWEAGWPFAIP